MDNVIVFDHPLIQHKISMLRNKNTGTNEFSNLVEELAMLEAVGMTGRQQKVKLMKEAVVYLIWTSICSTAVSTLLSFTLIKMLVAMVPMFSWNFTLVPLGVCLPFICLLVVIIPVIAHNRLCKKSVVDRLRVE